MPETRPVRRRLLRRLLLAFAALLCAALLAEAAVRVRQWFKYGSAANELYRTSIDPATGIAWPVPGQRTGRITINSLGFRGPELAVPKPAGTVRIAFLGGSTTFCAEASSDAATWPDLVCSALRERHPGLALDYVNAGVAGFGLDECLDALRGRVAALQPDVIVVYEATNDLSRDTRNLARAQGLVTAPPDGKSALARLSVAWDMLEKNLRVRSRMRAAATDVGRLRYEPAVLAEAFRERLRGLLERARSVAGVVAVATFAPRVRREQGPEERLQSCVTSLYYMPYMTADGILAGFEAYNGAIRQAAAAAGALLVEDETAIPADERHYNDSVHFTDAGCRKMAERVVTGLEASADFRELMARRPGAGR
jgi:lysophospholipase L1-like esterase